MKKNQFRRTFVGDNKESPKMSKNPNFLSSKSEPTEFRTKNMLKINFNVLEQAFTETAKRNNSFSFSKYRSHNVSADKFSLECQPPQQLKQFSKPIIHDTFFNYLSNNYKTFRISLNTVAIKKKFRFQKNGIGELACNLAKPKAISTQYRTSPQLNQKKGSLREIYKMRLRNHSPELNEWSKKLQLLQDNHSKVYAKIKTQQLPALLGKKKNGKSEHFKPWSNNDESFANKKPGDIKSSYDLYDILQ